MAAAHNPRHAQADQGHGIVNMQGSIIDTPCAIATVDREQSIEMMTTTVGEIIHNGRGNKNPFSLTLVNCNLHIIRMRKPCHPISRRRLMVHLQMDFFPLTAHQA
ncbi:TPA: hypothetical protein O8U57_004180 [Enterobacter asburiae]|uniref:fimbrial protein n=1 Tax=Enterobacter cloacae complex TaxID=354276 RepID=UPI000FDBDE1A|nr:MULTISPECIES: hypothetical protein [Enterobacter cloacae complex]HBM7599608.1 hypothetical protein [Enterobacter asburiae]HBM7609019.1 hypothetical protein [Enterobacter asburiae]HBM7635121.1 hypothetical protein [Enterobacter asburiae]HBM7660244.1 hypothetical protein [Enterobacter asburiae]HBM7674269.1 hypothetical protein [Enterobacter asburiae]